MLWYKSWRETRARVVMSVLALAWICAMIILFEGDARHASGESMTYASYVWSAVYKDYVRNLFLFLAIVLGGGTLVQESAHGSAGFTLALPVSRSRLLAVRAGVGLSEVALLALVPVVLIPLLSNLRGDHYPAAQALRFGIIWIVGGTLAFSLAQLLSALLDNEYVAWVGCFLVILFYEALVNVTALARIPALDLFRTMSGKDMPYFDATDHLIVGPLPWLSLAALLAISAAGFVATDQVLRRKDF